MTKRNSDAPPEQFLRLNSSFTATGRNILANGVQVITSSQDLLQIQPTDATLRIQSLTDDNGSLLGKVVQNNWSHISNIEISGPIGSSWFRYLAIKFPQVMNLTIDVDAICEETETTIQFPKVENLRVVNFHLCDEGAKFNWDFPYVKTVEVTESNLEGERYKFIHGFLRKYKNQLEKVIVVAEYCKNCPFHNIEFPRRTKYHFKRLQG